MDFFGGPRDGARQVVKGNPRDFVIPCEINGEPAIVIYRFIDGAYCYAGQVRDDQD